jgi:hypothetical protein
MSPMKLRNSGQFTLLFLINTVIKRCFLKMTVSNTLDIFFWAVSTIFDMLWKNRTAVNWKWHPLKIVCANNYCILCTFHATSNKHYSKHASEQCLTMFLPNSKGQSHDFFEVLFKMVKQFWDRTRTFVAVRTKTSLI